MKIVTAVAAFAALALAAPVAAQIGSDSYRFLEAVRKGDAATANGFISGSGPTVIDTRDKTNGDTALHIVTARRDLGWMALLIARGAKIDPRDKQGRTPLMIAADLGFAEGAEVLIGRRARLDEPNNQGETPLIRAVQKRDTRMTRLLLDAGADPDKPDTLAGMSARDYARSDARNAAVLRLIEQQKTRTKPKFGP